MFVRFAIVGLLVGTWALPSPPTVFGPDGKKMDVGAPTVFGPDGKPVSISSENDKENTSLGSLEDHRKIIDEPVQWKGPAEKYFHESTFDGHYDGRFADRTLAPELRNTALRALLRTYLATMHSLNAETWLMHGSLLGWWWNRRIMPWDSDIDVQVSEPALAFLAEHHNMSVHAFDDVDWLGEVDMGGRDVGVARRRQGRGMEGDEDVKKKEYLLEINPYWKTGGYADIYNVIDGRWIDMQTGLYIDITSVRWNQSSPVPGTLYCKDRHHYLSRQIFPLRTSDFEGVPAKVPYAYQELLAEEYGSKSLVQTTYRKEGHVFDKEKMEWVGMGRPVRGGGNSRQGVQETEPAKKKTGGRKKPDAKSNVRVETEDRLKPKERSRVHDAQGNGESVLTVVWRLFVGV